MDCPKDCEGQLKETTFGSVAVDQCGKCEGIWFDASEVRALVDHAQSKPDEMPPSTASPDSEAMDKATAQCPRCDEKLHRVESLAVEGLHYDQCMKCRGAWLDGGELAQIVKAPGADAMIKFFNEFD